MNKDSIIDYFGYILLRLSAPILRKLPLKFSLFLGAGLGELFYYFDLKHKSVAYSNIKTAFGARLSPSKISNLTKAFFRTFGQNLIEIFFIPLVNKEYINKYIKIEGLGYITEGFKKGKGVILLGMHEGSWELANVICANLGFPLNIFIRDQRYPRLNRLLNLYRSQKGDRLIQRQNETRHLIQLLKNNEAIIMTVDQGGKTGISVKFFGKDASMASGAIRLALKYDATIIPVFCTRQRGPYIKIIIEPLFKIRKTGNQDIDIRENLQEIVSVFEKYILKYPKEYLWSYKIWKYTKEMSILVLCDEKIGHLRQSQAVVKSINSYLKDKGVNVHIDNVDVKFKNKFARYALTLSACLAGKYHCQGCLWCLATFLKEETYKSLISLKPDIVVSCGSSLAPVNFIISRENLAKSVVIMRPSVLSTNRFDLAIVPQHDKPPKRKNVVVTEGALNLIDDDYIRSQVLGLRSWVKIEKDLVLGLLLGGNTKHFKLSSDLLRPIISQIKLFLEKHDGQILVTTSRRTSLEVEDLIKYEFGNYSRCKLLVIANEKNIPEAVGGILGLAKMVIVSPESISMISEAASCNRYIIVFKSKVNRRHNYFLNYMAKRKYIYLCQPHQLYSLIDKIFKEHPPINVLKDNVIVEDAFKRML